MNITTPQFTGPSPLHRSAMSSARSRPRDSAGSSFSFGPQHIGDSYLDGNISTLSFSQSLALDPSRSILHVSPLRSSPRRPRRPKDSFQRSIHPLANDTTDVFQDSEDDADDEDEHDWDIVDRMRLWRHDAMMQHLYETAAYWGDKILSWTSDPNDAFWLAQTYFMIHQYARAERLLTRPFPINPQMPTLHLNGNASVAMPVFEQPSSTLIRLPMGPGEVLAAGESRSNVSTLVELSVACRYLAAQCMVRQGNWSGATEILGENNPFRDSGRSGPAVPNVDGGIKIEASMCHLRGVVMQHLSRNEIAKECYMEALVLDVKCYESFDRLISTEMMTPDEEWDFVQSLPYAQQVPKDADFVQLMYTTRLRKYKHADEHTLTRQRLVQEYNLSDNPDVLFSFADSLYLSFRWKDCFTITSRILNLISIHNHTMPLHIACMFHINHLHSKLFILAHEMVEREPDNALSWYAVGVWYLGNQKWSTARQYFSKASLLDPRFAAAWVAFAHTFALEGEHDHAITAYSTSARMFTGSHLPLMFIGMEQLKLSNFALAGEALKAAYSMCDSDPLLINEMGVMAFNQEKYEEAAELFRKALAFAEITQSSRSNWASTYLNLGTAYRKLKRYDEAQKAYQQVLDLDPRNAVALGFMGMVYHLKGEIDQAILTYHEALSIEPINSHIMELLNMALEVSSMTPVVNSDAEFKSLILALKEKYQRSLDKGKERERPDVPTDVVPGNDVDDMNLG